MPTAARGGRIVVVLLLSAGRLVVAGLVLSAAAASWDDDASTLRQTAGGLVVGLCHAGRLGVTAAGRDLPASTAADCASVGSVLDGSLTRQVELLSRG